jgi:hypothetical protein
MSSLRTRRGLLLICAALGTGVARLSAQTPTAECSVPASPGGQSASAPAVVSGVRYVRLSFELWSNGAMRGEPRFGVGDTPSSTVRIAVWRIEDGRRDRVAYVLEQEGGSFGQDGSRYFESLAMRIPVDDERRARDIRAYLDWVEATEGSDPRNADIIARLKAQRDRAIIAMEAIYLQNLPGLYVVECAYTSTEPGAWQGTARAPALYLRVRDDERFFDQPAFKRQPAAR